MVKVEDSIVLCAGKEWGSVIGENIVSVRKIRGFSQEALAEKVGVTRQTVSKWEAGESLPDLEKAAALAEALDVSVDELISYDRKRGDLPMPPKGKHLFGMVTVGDKGQIVIPARARKIFAINPGDRLIVLGDEAQGLALMGEKKFMEFVKAVTEMSGGDNK